MRSIIGAADRHRDRLISTGPSSIGDAHRVGECEALARRQVVKRFCAGVKAPIQAAAGLAARDHRRWADVEHGQRVAATATANGLGCRAAGLAVEGAGTCGSGPADRIGNRAAAAVETVIGNQTGGCGIGGAEARAGDLIGTAKGLPDANVGNFALEILGAIGATTNPQGCVGGG